MYFICIDALGHDIKQIKEKTEKREKEVQNIPTGWQLRRAPSSNPTSPLVCKGLGCYHVCAKPAAS